MSAPAFIGPFIVTERDPKTGELKPKPCGVCGELRHVFVNTFGSTHCLGCEGRKVIRLPVPRTPQTAEDMCEALRQSIERARK